jgi:type I restriction enzyme, S subunit
MKQNNIQIPEGYINSSLGIIPQDWEVKRLGILCQLKSGQDLIPESYSNTIGKYPYVTGASSLCDHSGIIFNRWTNAPTSIAIKGDILLVCKGSGVGRLTILDNAAEAHIARQIMSIRPKIDVERDYLYFQLKLLVDSIKKRARGVIPGIDRGSILSLKILLPPFPQQQKIAEILGTWDEAIEKQSTLIDRLTERKRGLMQRLLTGKKRLAGFNEEWKEVRLGAICEIKKGKAISSKDITDGIYPVIAGGQSSPYKHNKYTDENIITISASGAYAGYVALHKYKMWASDCSVIKSVSNVSSIDFLYALLCKNQKYLYSLQSGGAQPHIYPNDISGLKYKLPSFPEQTTIAKILTAADKEIELAKSKLELLLNQKSGLMQQLLTGKKRVKI